MSANNPGGRAGVDGQRDYKRFTTGNHPDVEDVADPHTTEDDTHTPLRERAWEYRWFLVLGVPIGLAAIAVLIGYTWHLIPDILGNRYVQLGSLFLTVIGVTAYLADRRRESAFMQYQWLVLRTKDGPKRFLGYLKQDSSGAPLFEPVKGMRRFGSLAERYTIEEFGAELGESWAKLNRDPSDPAMIRLHPAFVSITQTDLGTIIEQSTTKIKVDPFGRNSTLYAPMPDLVQDEIAENLKTELIRTREEREELEDRLNDFQRRLEAAKDIGAMEPEEFLQSHKEFYKELREVDRGRHGGTATETGEDSGPLGPSTQTDPELRQVEAELSSDD
ncbi:hypothetical protein [Natrinema ejinorense]|uniref:Uncharacterized protein n=1 Tax=Natrinema ejinorense TaxID=373386 RepID=A0A2A5QPG8_9EURY|nr:hypothetical protein [Natrinema ejinorense]PCR88699.1 hypothetical protein CP557_21970 [Natrinema ejinorense]